MQFPQTSFDAETVALMRRTFDDAWSEFTVTTFLPSEADESVVKTAMAQLILCAVADGERDYLRLMSIALGRQAP